MRVQLVGLQESPVTDHIRAGGDEVITTQGRINLSFCAQAKPDFLVSYGASQIFTTELLDFFRGNAINLHPSFLPFNRGTDPSFWSCVDGTPNGATIHYLDYGIDTGDIIAQQQVFFSGTESLRRTYQKLHIVLQQLFIREWTRIRSGTCQRTPQRAGGSFHRPRDKEPLMHLLKSGWDTPVSVLMNYGKSLRS